MRDTGLDYDSPASSALSRGQQSRDEPAFRPEFPCRSAGARADHSGPRRGSGHARMGNRARLGANDRAHSEKGALLTAFEIDYGFVRLLERLFSGHDNFSIVKGDMLKTWRTQTAQPDRIFGNLPTMSPSTSHGPSQAWLRSAAHGVHASEGSRETHDSPARQQRLFRIQCLFAPCATAHTLRYRGEPFWPQPRVTSSVVQIVPKMSPCPWMDAGLFRFCAGVLFFAAEGNAQCAVSWARANFPSLEEGELVPTAGKSEKHRF